MSIDFDFNQGQLQIIKSDVEFTSDKIEPNTYRGKCRDHGTVFEQILDRKYAHYLMSQHIMKVHLL